jgi:hypothetical protein
MQGWQIIHKIIQCAVLCPYAKKGEIFRHRQVKNIKHSPHLRAHAAGQFLTWNLSLSRIRRSMSSWPS